MKRVTEFRTQGVRGGQVWREGVNERYSRDVAGVSSFQRASLAEIPAPAGSTLDGCLAVAVDMIAGGRRFYPVHNLQYVQLAETEAESS